MNPTKKHWRVEVRWEDSQIIRDGWGSASSAVALRKRVRCHSVGFILADDDEGMVLAGSVNGSNVTGVVIIPRSQIKKVTRLH